MVVAPPLRRRSALPVLLYVPRAEHTTTDTHYFLQLHLPPSGSAQFLGAIQLHSIAQRLSAVLL